jgi:hypothetical protein
MGDRLTVLDDRGSAYTEALDDKPAVLAGSGIVATHTIALQLINSRTIRETEAIKGVSIAVTTSEISRDGKVMTQTSVDPRSRRTPEVSVFNRQ